MNSIYCIDEKKNNERISFFTVCFCAFLALSWVQTGQQNTGTWIAVITIIFTVIAAVISNKINLYKVDITILSFSLVLLLIYIFFSSLVMNNLSEWLKLFAQMLLFLIVCGVHLNQNELKLIKAVYIISASILSILVIVSCYIASFDGYYHGIISILGTEYNPNHIGLPLLALFCILYHSFLFEKKKLFTLVLIAVNVIAIFYTGSRGNVFSLAIVFSLITLYWLKDNHSQLFQKISIALLVIGIVMVAATLFRELLPRQWERIISTTIGDDNGRYNIWSSALEGYMERPLFGHGAGSMFQNFGVAAHNTYIEILYEFGVTGEIIFLIFFCTLFAKNIKAKNKIMLFAIIMIATRMLFLSSLDDRTVWALFCWASMLSESDRHIGKAKQDMLLKERE